MNGPPYHLALIFGLLVSATLYMLFVWPRHEPEDERNEPEDERNEPEDERNEPEEERKAGEVD